jgi:hypothetical protein
LGHLRAFPHVSSRAVQMLRKDLRCFHVAPDQILWFEGKLYSNQRFFRENHGDRVPNWATPATFSRAGWLPTVITCYHYWFPDFFYSLFMFYDYDNRIMACSNIIGS